MADPFDPDAYVPQAAAALGLPIAPSDLGDVIGSFAVLARVADVVMGFPLPEELIGGAIFTAEKRKA
jgi:hypothetical protein